MGTKLGNIHIRNASPEEVSALLPGALIGRWGEGFVSAYHEDFQWGSVERAGQKLSRKLPTATVLTAAVFDDDMTAFAVFQAGKRLTYHLLDPYEGQNKAGNPKLFCEVLGLPPEDEKRLKVIWKKGDACEQMELTAALLGLPLWADTEWQPKKTARDTTTVDTWIADHPDPPKVKSVTRAELIQELPQMIMTSSFTMVGEGKYHILTPTDQEDYTLPPTNQLWRLDSDEGLVCVGAQGGFEPEETYCIQGERIVALQQLWSEMGTAVGSRIGYDSQGILPWQKSLECEGRAVIANDPRTIRLLPDGGFWGGFVLARDYGPPVYLAARFGLDGCPCWSKTLPQGVSVMGATIERIYISYTDDEEHQWLSWLDLEGQQSPGTEVEKGTHFCAWGEGLYLARTDYHTGKSVLLHLNADLNPLGRMELPGTCIWNLAFSPQRDILFLSSYTQGLWLLNARDLSIHQALLSKEKYVDAYADGVGRYWVCSGGSTLVGYDGFLRPISRHRLKGAICGVIAAETGLTVMTYDKAQYDYQMVEGELIAKPKNPKRPFHILRVYRIS